MRCGTMYQLVYVCLIRVKFKLNGCLSSSEKRFLNCFSKYFDCCEMENKRLAALMVIPKSSGDTQRTTHILSKWTWFEYGIQSVQGTSERHNNDSSFLSFKSLCSRYVLVSQGRTSPPYMTNDKPQWTHTHYYAARSAFMLEIWSLNLTSIDILDLIMFSILLYSRAKSHLIEWLSVSIIQIFNLWECLPLTYSLTQPKTYFRSFASSHYNKPKSFTLYLRIAREKKNIMHNCCWGTVHVAWPAYKNRNSLELSLNELYELWDIERLRVVWTTE